MALYVQKFGGTSVGSLERINLVADKVLASHLAGNRVVVVVSAMSGETDKLESMAKAMSPNPSPRELDVLYSTGEQVSMSLLAMALIERGVPSRSFTGGQVRILTDDAHNKARILDIDSEPLHKVLNQGEVAIVAGFQGVDDKGNITTLGRGGSDTTAVAIAAALGADECQIYTDVDGVYTTDPRVVPQARRMPRVTFEEMLELSSLGAKVLQIRSVEFAGKYSVPLRVLSTFEDGPGTLITYEETEMEQEVVSGIAFNRNEAKLTIFGVPDIPGVAGKILGPISDAGIVVDMIVQNMSANSSTDFSFTVPREDYERSRKILSKISDELSAKGIAGSTDIAKVSIVGVGMRSHAGVASKMFAILGKEGINIQAITTSEIKVSVVVDEKYLELAIRTLHSALNLNVEAVEEKSAIVLGK